MGLSNTLLVKLSACSTSVFCPFVNIIITSQCNSVNGFINLDYQRFVAVIHSCCAAVNGNVGYFGNPQHKDTAANVVESASHRLNSEFTIDILG
jgi:hypothetical protein